MAFDYVAPGDAHSSRDGAVRFVAIDFSLKEMRSSTLRAPTAAEASATEWHRGWAG